MRRFLLLLVGAATLYFATSCDSVTDREKVLKIYNWADYMDESLIGEFEDWYEEQTGEKVRIIYQTFDQNEVALAKIERAAADYDLLCPSEYIVERMLTNDLLIPIDKDFGSTPNYLGNVAPYFTEIFEQFSTPEKKASDYTVPFMWGTTGILYNTRTVTREEASSWDIIWDSKFKNRIFLKDAVRDIYSITQIYINQDKINAGVPIAEVMNNLSQEAVDRAAVKLIEARKNVAGWETDFGKEMMTQEKADLNLSWSGDAVWAIEEGATVGVEFDYVVPVEGSNVWFDGWVIPKYAVNVKAASYFINFMCMPENALRNMDEIGYVSSIGTPEVLEAVIDESLDEYSDLSYIFGEAGRRVKVDPVQYPDISVIERCAVMRDFGDDSEIMMVMWATIKGDNLSAGMLAVIAVTVLAMLGYYGYSRYSAYKMKRFRQARR